MSCGKMPSKIRWVPLLDMLLCFITQFWHFPKWGVHLFCLFPSRNPHLKFRSVWQLPPKETRVRILLLNWARLLRSPVYRSCHRIKSLVLALCEMRLCYGCQWQVISHWTAWTSSCLPHYPAHIYHLQGVIIPLKTTLPWSLRDPLLCTDKHARKLLIIHSCAIVKYCQSLLFLKGTSQNSFFLSLTIFSLGT